MILANDLIEKFRYALDTGWGYIWGTAGIKWTEARQAAATREMTVKYGSKWIGRMVADCSGLFAWAFKKLGGSIYHGSNTIWNKYCSAQGKLLNGKRTDGQALRPGTAVFLLKDGNRHHIGLYIGNGECIEAKGTQYGVVKSKINHWDEWGELKDVEYGEEQKGGEAVNTTLRKGDRGGDVQRLQEALNRYGYRLEEDGIFGTKTEQAVRAFQQAHYLTADGVCGPQTWAALEDGTPPAEQTDDITIPREALEELRAMLGDIVAWINERLEG